MAAVCPCGVCRTLSLQGTGLQPLLSCGGLRHCEYLVVFSAAQQLSSDLVTASRPSWTGSFSPKENLLICVAQAASGKVVQDGHLAGLAPHKRRVPNLHNELQANADCFTNNIKKKHRALLTLRKSNPKFLVPNSVRACWLGCYSVGRNNKPSFLHIRPWKVSGWGPQCLEKVSKKTTT